MSTRKLGFHVSWSSYSEINASKVVRLRDSNCGISPFIIVLTMMVTLTEGREGGGHPWLRMLTGREGGGKNPQNLAYVICECSLTLKISKVRVRQKIKFGSGFGFIKKI